MAAKRPGRPKDLSRGTSPVVGLLLAVAGAGLAVLVGGGVFFLIFRDRPEAPPDPPVVEIPVPPTPPPTPPARIEAWWEGAPDSNLAGTATFLKEALPQEKALFVSLGSKNAAVRLEAYQKLLVKLPEVVRNPKAKMLVESFLIDCYALEPVEKNTIPMREWLIKQIPGENAAFPPTYKIEDLDRSFWAVKISIEALTHNKMQPDRVAHLSQALGKAFGREVNPTSAPAAELQVKTEKLLALRCYRNLVPTAARSLPESLAVRDMLLKKAADILSPASRLKVDAEIAFNGLSGAKTAWVAYGPLLRDCLEAKDMSTDLAILAMYDKADPDLAEKMEPVLADRWSGVFKEAKMNQKARVAALRRVLGVPEPINRLTQLEKLAKETLGSANSPAAKTHAVLQETVRLSHASTLACALLKKGTGLERFDELVSVVPEIEEPQVAKEDKAKKPDNEPKESGVDPVVGKGKPIIIPGMLRPGVPRNVHSVPLKRGRTYFIHMVSGAFDTYLYLHNSRGIQLAQDDDSGGDLNALITFTAPVDDKYNIIATSFGKRSAGPYTLSITEANGVGGPPGMFPPPGFGGPMPFGPPRRFPNRFPPPRMFPGPPVMIPGPPVVQPQDDKTPAVENLSLVDEGDLKNLGTTVARTRLKAFLTITSKLKGNLSEKDLTLPHATKIAKFLVEIPDAADVDEVTPQLAPYAKSRNLVLALADAVDLNGAKKEATEAVVGAICDQPLLFSKDAWRPACRKLMTLQALDLSVKSSGATDAAEFLRELYQEQGVLLGMDAKVFEKLTRPSQVMAIVIKHLASELGKTNPAKEDKDYLGQVPRHLQAAQFVAQNDLEHTVVLQRVWIKVLAIYLEQQNPGRAKELRQIQSELNAAERGWANVLEQLRGGEEKILRLWSLALELK